MNRKGTLRPGNSWEAMKAASLKLPQAADEVWEADIRRFPGWVQMGNKTVRPWISMVTSRSREQVLVREPIFDEPEPGRLQEALTKAMFHPLLGGPLRPSEVNVASPEYREALAFKLMSIGVRCAACDRLELVEYFFAALAHEVAGHRGIPAMVDIPGATFEMLRVLFATAASFWERAPWNLILTPEPIRIECDGFEKSPLYALVLGRSGLLTGLTLYDDLELARGATKDTRSEEELKRRESVLSLTFCEETMMAVSDLDAAEAHGWEVAGPRAYPLLFKLRTGGVESGPTAREVEVMAACLASVPMFLDSIDFSAHKVLVWLRSRWYHATLSWVDH